MSRLNIPKWLVIGAMKAGTTSIYGYLTASNLVPLARKKEVDFFNKHWYAGIEWYSQQFQLSARPIGEASPLYIQNPKVPKRIKEICPGVKMIAILRNPVERAFSHYMMQWQHVGYEIYSFDYAVRNEHELCTQTPSRTWWEIPDYNMDWTAFAYKRLGQYSEQLEWFYKEFPREQILVLQFEDLVDNPKRNLEKIHEHLGLNAEPNLRFWRKLNRGKYDREMKPETREYLKEHFEPWNERLYNLLGVDYHW